MELHTGEHIGTTQMFGRLKTTRKEEIHPSINFKDPKTLYFLIL